MMNGVHRAKPGEAISGGRSSPNLFLALALATPLFVQAASPEAVFQRASPSVVVIAGSTSVPGKLKLGSGVVVAKNRVVTNCHVVDDLARIQIAQGEKTGSAVLEKRHPYVDLCLLRIAGISTTAIARLVDLRSLRVGQYVYAIGAPSGLELTLTEGLVSGVRKIEEATVIQTSAAISPGSSGGGLFDDQGQLIGITTFGISGQSLNFALPADLVAELLREPVTSQPTETDEHPAAFSDWGLRGRPPAQLTFENEADGRRWLHTMEERLAARIPNATQQQDFLVAAHFEALRAGLDPQFVLALIEVLSGFRKYQVSRAGARGYMQVQPRWVGLLGRPEDNLFHLRTNLRYGCVIMRHYLDEVHGSYAEALAAYWADSRKNPKLRGDVEFPRAVVRAWKTTWRYAGPTR